MGKLDEKLLERYFDGELSPREAQRVEQLLEADEEMSEQLPRLERMSDLVRLMHGEDVADADFENLKNNIAAQIEASQKVPLAERARVWLHEFIEHRKTVWVPGAVVAAGACALLLALPMLTTTTSPPRGTAPSVDTRIWTASHTRAPSSRVVEVEYQAGEYRVFDVENAQGGTSTVVWLDELDALDEQRP